MLSSCLPLEIVVFLLVGKTGEQKLEWSIFSCFYPLQTDDGGGGLALFLGSDSPHRLLASGGSWQSQHNEEIRRHSLCISLPDFDIQCKQVFIK